MTDERNIIGGLMVRIDGRLFSSSVRNEMMLAPACWRCGDPLYLDKAALVPGHTKAHPWVWACVHCVTDDDTEAVAKPEGRGVK